MKLTKRLGMVLLSVGLLVQPVRAEPVNVSVDNTLANKYMFWGLKFGQNPVLQSMVNVNRGNLIVTGFANTDLKTKEVNEGDVFVDYSSAINDRIHGSLGCGFYNLKVGKTWERDQEAYAGISFAGPLNTGLVYHRLFGLGKGDYIEIKTGRNFNINEEIGLDIFANMGYHNNGYREKSGFNHVEAGTKVNIPLTERINLQPSLRFTKSLANDVTDEFSGGINVSVRLR